MDMLDKVLPDDPMVVSLATVMVCIVGMLIGVCIGAVLAAVIAWETIVAASGTKDLRAAVLIDV